MAEADGQDTPAALASLFVDLWPDYDKPSVLVLLTGTLPDDSKLPASVSIPIPESARLNAVARIDGKDGSMVDDILFNRDAAGTLKFVIPDLRFRVEYYYPYTADNDQRSFDYTWIADLSIDRLQLRVQRPLSAVSLNISPESGNVVRGGDGFDYHAYPVRAVPAGQPFTIHVAYKMAADRLSAESLPQQNAGRQPEETPAKSISESGIGWPVVAVAAGGLIIVVVLVWQVASRRSSSGAAAGPRAGATGQSRAGFCRNCGAALDGGDRFCSGCGRRL